MVLVQVKKKPRLAVGFSSCRSGKHKKCTRSKPNHFINSALGIYPPGGGVAAVERTESMSQFGGNPGVPGERSLLAGMENPGFPGERSLLAGVESCRGGKHKKCTKSKLNRFRNSV